MSKAVKSLWNISQDDVMREILNAEEKRRKDQLTREECALEEGLEKGLQKGREEGQLKERKAIAHNLIKIGTNLKFVSKATGLSLKN